MKTTLKKLIKLILVIGGLVVSLHFILLQWNFNYFLPQIESYLSDNYPVNVKFLGEVKVKILPLPKVVITNIELSKKDNKQATYIPKVQIKINLLRFFMRMGILDLHSISLHHPKIKIYNDASTYFRTLKEVISNQVHNDLSSKISIINGTLQVIDDDTEIVTKQMNNLHLSYNNFDGKNLKVSTSFTENGDSHSFLLSAKNLDKNLNPTNLTIVLKYNLLHLHVNLHKDIKSNTLLGKANIHIYDKTDNEITDIEKFVCQQNFKKVGADVELNQELLKVSNFVTTSVNVKNVKGSASYHINSNTLNLNIAIDDLNLDAILLKLYGKETINNFNVTELLNFITKKRNLVFSKFVTTYANLHIGKLFYKEDNIDNIALSFSFWPSQKSNNRKILINNFSMVLPGSSKFEIQGVILNDKIPTFKGQALFISTQPKDLLLWYHSNLPLSYIENIPTIIKSEIILMPYVLQLHNIQTAFKDTHILAEILTLNHPDASDIQIYTEIVANKTNLDSLNIDNKLNDLVYTLYSSDFDNSGKTFTKKTDNLRSIRSQKGFKNFAIEVKELTIKNEVFYGFNVNIDIDKLHLKLDHLNANSRLVSYTGGVQLNLLGIKPELNIDLSFSKLNDELFYVMFPSQKDLKELYQKEILQEKQDNPPKISDINFYGINNFSGKFKFIIDKLHTESIDLSNVKLSGDIVNGGIEIDKANAQGFNGDIKITGNIFTLQPVFGLNFGIGLNNINPSLLLNYLTGSNNNTGYMSTAGVLSTKGVDRKSFVKNLEGKFHMQGKNIKHKNFGLLELAELPQLEMGYNEKLKRLNYYKQYGETQFDDIVGDLVINKGTAKIINMELTNKKTSGLLNFLYSFVDTSLNGNAKFSFIPNEREKPIIINVNSSGNISNTQVKVNTDGLKKYLERKRLSKQVPHQ